MCQWFHFKRRPPAVTGTEKLARPSQKYFKIYIQILTLTRQRLGLPPQTTYISKAYYISFVSFSLSFQLPSNFLCPPARGGHSPLSSMGIHRYHERQLIRYMIQLMRVLHYYNSMWEICLPQWLLVFQGLQICVLLKAKGCLVSKVTVSLWQRKDSVGWLSVLYHITFLLVLEVTEERR